jgi:hypothetical protein
MKSREFIFKYSISPVRSPFSSKQKISATTLQQAGSAILNPSGKSLKTPIQFQSRGQIRREKSKSNIIYTAWEIYEANKELKEKSSEKNLSHLRRNLKNPHIYVGNNEATEEQDKQIGEHLIKAFEKILID